ncbi:MAG: hypothetical protein KatS3mg110_1069 [Pirellulaceae bacterium]|nr:MAG: hypothetical protein KatS3mg110_1069 [Pirellulaceae bacterium]
MARIGSEGARKVTSYPTEAWRQDSQILACTGVLRNPSPGRIAGSILGRNNILVTPVGFWKAVRAPGQEPNLKAATTSGREGEARMTGRFFAWAPFSTEGAFVHETIFTSKVRMQESGSLKQVDEISKTATPNGDRLTIKVSLYRAADPGNKTGELTIVLDTAMGWEVQETDVVSYRPGEKYRHRMEVEYDGTAHGI